MSHRANPVTRGIASKHCLTIDVGANPSVQRLLQVDPFCNRLNYQVAMLQQAEVVAVIGGRDVPQLRSRGQRWRLQLFQHTDGLLDHRVGISFFRC